MSTFSTLREKFGSAQLISRFLTIIEKGGNALPHPASLFGIMALLAIVASGITSLLDISVIHPGTGETIRPVNLFMVVRCASGEGPNTVSQDVALSHSTPM